MSAKGFCRYLGTIAGMVERQAGAIKTNGQEQSATTRVASLIILRGWDLLIFLGHWTQ